MLRDPHRRNGTPNLDLRRSRRWCEHSSREVNPVFHVSAVQWPSRFRFVNASVAVWFHRSDRLHVHDVGPIAVTVSRHLVSANKFNGLGVDPRLFFVDRGLVVPEPIVRRQTITYVSDRWQRQQLCRRHRRTTWCNDWHRALRLSQDQLVCLLAFGCPLGCPLFFGQLSSLTRCLRLHHFTRLLS